MTPNPRKPLLVNLTWTGLLLVVGCVAPVWYVLSPFIALRRAADSIRSIGGSVDSVVWAPKYVTFGPKVSSDDICKSRPARESLWSVEHVRLNGTTGADEAVVCIEGFRSMNLLVIQDTDVSAAALRRFAVRNPDVVIDADVPFEESR